MAGVKSPYREMGMSYSSISHSSNYSKLDEKKLEALREYNKQYARKRRDKKRIEEMLKENKAPYFNVGSGGKG